MKTINEMRQHMSLFRPSMYWEFGWKEHDSRSQEAWERLYNEFQKRVGDLTPDEYNLQHWKLIITQGFEDPEEYWNSCLNEWANRVSDTIEGDPEELVRIQVGTSKTRAKAFVKEGQGYVKLEGLAGDPSWELIDRLFGLQVAILGDSCRSGIDRLNYYARVQADRMGDEPVVLTALVAKRYISYQKNKGEYMLSKKYYDKLQNPEILSPYEYKMKYMA